MHKFKNYILLVLLIIFISTVIFAGQNYSIYTKEGNPIDIDKASKSLIDFDIIFIGEFHGHPAIHEFQHQILELLFEGNNSITVSMEMFERDVQNILDKFLSGDISHDDFIKASRPWNNYDKDYKPIVKFAKNNNLPVIAANIPRRIASLYARTGSLEKLKEDDRKYYAETIHAFDDEYKETFLNTMKEMKHHMMSDSKNNQENLFERMYYAQCMKDDTMAESIYFHHKKNPERIIIHFNGDFHSKKYLGTVHRVKLRKEDLNIAVISPVMVSDLNNIEWLSEYSSFGDLILFVEE